MGFILFIIIIYFVGALFEKTDNQLSKEAEKLPPFTKQEAFDYYENILKNNKQE
jgi:hypothetical protein